MAPLVLPVVGGDDHLIALVAPALQERGEHRVHHVAGVIHLFTVVIETVAHAVQSAGVQDAIIDAMHLAQPGERGEKIDIVDYSEDIAKFVAQALSPAKVSASFVVNDGAAVRGEHPKVRVLVPEYQLSLAIGKEGQNARLAAKLTGAKIDIQPDSVMDED